MLYFLHRRATAQGGSPQNSLNVFTDNAYPGADRVGIFIYAYYVYRHRSAMQ